jgi:FkbM family methyltransferase
MGHAFRTIGRRIPGFTVKQNIGYYGPFNMVSEFAFSDFRNWGRAHNRAFNVCVDACRGKTCVFDVGAHIGLLALPAASVLAEGGRLFAFEPAKANAKILRRHLALNNVRNIEVVEALVGDSDRERVEFYESAGPHGQNSVILKSDRALASEWGDYSKTGKRQISLDSYCEHHGLRPQLIKIDVEGSEIGVLRGARSILKWDRPQIILSVHPREIALVGEKLCTLREMLDELDYDVRDVNGQPVAEFRLDEYVVTPR